jgi:hypothetical protein
MKKFILLGSLLTILSSNVLANHWVTGKITRTLSDHYYGGMMIHLDRKIGGGCPNSGWVSLDMAERYVKNAKSREKAALLAFALDKKVSVYVHTSQKHNTYCVARRVDILK